MPARKLLGRNESRRIFLDKEISGHGFLHFCDLSRRLRLPDTKKRPILRVGPPVAVAERLETAGNRARL